MNKVRTNKPKLIKSLVLFLILIIAFSCVQKEEKTESIFIVDAKVRATYPKGCTALSKQPFCIIECSLYNNTDSEKSFWSLSSCWKDTWVISSDKYSFCNEPCNRNFPRKYSIGPHKKMIFESLLVASDSLKDKLKIGFIFIKENEFGSTPYLDLYRIIENKKERNIDIFWSKELYLKDIIRGYEIE